MGSLRFPFPFPPPQKPPNGISFRRVAVAVTAVAAVAAGAGLTLSASLKPSASALRKPCDEHNDDASHLWAASVSLDGGPTRTAMYVDPRSKVEFPMVIDGEKRLLSVGTRLRRPTFHFGMSTLLFFKQTINQSTEFSVDPALLAGVYADGGDVKRLSKKYGAFSDSELKASQDFIADVLDQDLRITIRFQKYQNSLNMKFLREEFQRFVGSSLRKFSGSNNKELLKRYELISKCITFSLIT
ncbi:fatty-acid-binding protein 1-like [Curcuma longa]|uniref:fatty-acid-binding protein 1-like n=1 Tax=Curcuma longa TaxID=136217 RepID=UPI003D9E6EB5